MQPVVLILDVTNDLDILMDRCRDECFFSGDEPSQKTVDDEGAGEAPDVEHVVDLGCAADLGLKAGIDLRGPDGKSAEVLAIWDRMCGSAWRGDLHSGNVRDDGHNESDYSAPIGSKDIVAVAAMSTI